MCVRDRFEIELHGDGTKNEQKYVTKKKFMLKVVQFSFSRAFDNLKAKNNNRTDCRFVLAVYKYNKKLVVKSRLHEAIDYSKSICKTNNKKKMMNSQKKKNAAKELT